MGVISNEKRRELISEMEDLLEKYNHNYTHDGVVDIVNEWMYQKEGLINLFRKHPKWSEEHLAIVYEGEFNREFETEPVFKFCDELVTKISKDKLYFEPIGNIINHILFNCEEQFIIDEEVEFCKNYDPDFKLHKGEKRSRVINRICASLGYDNERWYTGEKSYAQAFAAFADAINPVKIKKEVVISLNPLDYLTMSFGNSWASCHTIDRENIRGMNNSYHGMYCSGTLSYMLDNSSMVFYIPAESESNSGKPYCMRAKEKRNMFHYSVEDKTLIQGRLYPQSHDDEGKSGLFSEVRSIVQDTIAKAEGLSNLWKITGDSMYDCVEDEGTHYRDYTNFSQCNCTYLKEARESHGVVYIGADPICPYCGCRHGESESLNCSDCADKKHECYDCGRIHDEEDMYEIDGEWYCSNCVFYCEHHDRMEPDRYRHDDDVEDFGAICDDAYTYSDEYRYCDECGRLYRVSDMDSEFDNLCEDCADEKRERLAEEGEENYDEEESEE